MFKYLLAVFIVGLSCDATAQVDTLHPGAGEDTYSPPVVLTPVAQVVPADDIKSRAMYCVGVVTQQISEMKKEPLYSDKDPAITRSRQWHRNEGRQHLADRFNQLKRFLSSVKIDMTEKDVGQKDAAECYAEIPTLSALLSPDAQKSSDDARNRCAALFNVTAQHYAHGLTCIHVTTDATRACPLNANHRTCIKQYTTERGCDNAYPPGYNECIMDSFKLKSAVCLRMDVCNDLSWLPR